MSERSIGVVEGASAALVGAGIVTLALFPLALPLIALTGVALMPFIVVGLALVLIAVPPLLVARWLRRRAWRPRPASSQTDRARAALLGTCG